MDRKPDPEKSLLTFPTAFPIKVMGRREDGFAQAVSEVVLKHAPDFDPATMEMRSSKQGRYLSLTVTINARSREQLDALYQEGTERLLRDFHDAISAYGPGLAQLWAIASAYRTFAHAEPALFQLMFSRADPDYRPNEEVKSRSAGLFDLLVGELTRRPVGGDLRALRLALTGAERGPELWTVLLALSRDEALRRVDAAL